MIEVCSDIPCSSVLHFVETCYLTFIVIQLTDCHEMWSGCGESWNKLPTVIYIFSIIFIFIVYLYIVIYIYIYIYIYTYIHIYVFISIYLFALCYICFCLLILLILLFPVVDVVVVFSVNSCCCSCSGFSMCFTFLSVIALFCLCCHYVLEPSNPVAIITLYLFLLLFKLLTHC